MATDDLLEAIQINLAETEAERARIADELGRAEGPTADALRQTLQELDEQLGDSRAKLAAVEARLARTERMRAITSELERLHTELQDELRQRGPSPHAHALRARAEELVAEGKTLTGPSKTE